MKYFLHNVDSLADDKVALLFIEHGYEGVGLFYCILEKLAKKEKAVNTKVLKHQLKVGKKLEKCWKFMEEIELISSNNGETFNENLLNFGESMTEKREKKRKWIQEQRENQNNTNSVDVYRKKKNDTTKTKTETKTKTITIESKDSDGIDSVLPVSSSDFDEEKKGNPEKVAPKKPPKEPNEYSIVHRIRMKVQADDPEYKWRPREAAAAKGLADQIFRSRQVALGRDPTDDELMKAFEDFILMLPPRIKTKWSLAVLDSQYTTIRKEIKDLKNGSKDGTTVKGTVKSTTTPIDLSGVKGLPDVEID